MKAIEHEVKRDHDGDWKQYLDHLYQIDRRNTPPEELHQLHERWYTANLVDWVARMGSVQKEVTVLDQKVHKTFLYQIMYEKRTCMISENVQATVEADLHAVITADVQTSGVMTLIGNMVRLSDSSLLCQFADHTLTFLSATNQNDMSSFKHSYVNFRNKGEIKASLVFNAYGELRIPYKEETLLGKYRPSTPEAL